MKYVEFKKISIVNFFSIGKEPVVIEFDPGMHIITGINKDMMDRRNAVGKSTIIDALHFAVFGTTIRDIKKDFIANDVTNGTCTVELTFTTQIAGKTTNYHIIRQINPGKCYLFENGADITRDSIASTTQYICELLDATPTIFQNCVVMSLIDTVPFMAQKQVEKRKFIESIFNLQVFGKMLSHVREDFIEAKKMYELELYKLNKIEDEIKQAEEHRLAIIKERANKVEQLRLRKADNERERDTLLQKLDAIPTINTSEIHSQIQEVENGLERLQTQIDSRIQDIAANKVQVENLHERYMAIGTDKDTCPTCLRPIDSNNKEHMHAEKAVTKSAIDDIDKKLKSSNKVLDGLRDKKTLLKSHISKLRVKLTQSENIARDREILSSKIASFDKWLGDVDSDIIQLQNASTTIDDSIVVSRDKIPHMQDTVKDALSVVNMLDTAKIALSEEGVKAYITKRVLEVLNGKIQMYLKKIGFTCTCTFNEFFEEQFINNRGKICSYFNFSGAERRSIDLACLFAFIDIRKTRGNVSYNIVFYDELLDIGLDDTGLQLACDIIVERTSAFNESAFIITHRRDSKSLAGFHVINLEKENNITRRVD